MIPCTRIWTTAAFLFAAMAMPVWTAAQDAPSHDQQPKHSQYKLIDLGTLGGPQSYLFDFTVRNINNSGTVIAQMDTATPDPFFPNCFVDDCFVTHATTSRRGELTDLGALPGGSAVPDWISDSGLVAGFSENGLNDPIIDGPQLRAVLWNGHGITDLGTFGGYESQAFAVNSQGLVVGCSTNTVPDDFGWVLCAGLGAQSQAFLWRDGVMRDLGTLGGNDAAANYVNERGQVAGFSFTNNIVNDTTGLPTFAPFLWDNGQMTNLGGFGGTLGRATGLSDSGQVPGWSNLPGDQTWHPFLWDRGVLRDLGTLGGATGEAHDVNGKGEVVGVADTPTTHDGFLWRNGVMIDLGNLGISSFAYHINSKSQVVGGSRVSDTLVAGFLWENGSIADINGLIENGSTAQLVYPFSINESGEISVRGYLPSGDWHAFTMIPDGDCDDHDYQVRLRAHRENLASLVRVTGNPGQTVTSDAPPGRALPGFKLGSSRLPTIQDRHATSPK